MSRITQWITVIWIASLLTGCAVYPVASGPYYGGYAYPLPPARTYYVPDPFTTGIVTGVIVGGALHRGQRHHQHHRFHRH